MTEQVLYQNTRPHIRATRIFLPTEHGSWSFLLEPLLVGCVIAASAAAPWIALMVIAAFFARQPLKVYSLSQRNPETASLALRFLLVFLAASGAGLSGAIWQSGVQALLPLAAALPLAMVQVFQDISKRSRSLSAELTGAVAIAAPSAALALAAGFSWTAALSLWLVFACRFVPSILYVRNRLLLEKGKPNDSFWPVLAHLGALAAVSALAFVGSASWLTASVFAFLLARSVLGLSKYRAKMKAMKIGIWELVYGVLTVISIIAGYYLGI